MCRVSTRATTAAHNHIALVAQFIFWLIASHLHADTALANDAQSAGWRSDEASPCRTARGALQQAKFKILTASCSGGLSCPPRGAAAAGRQPRGGWHWGAACVVELNRSIFARTGGEISWSRRPGTGMARLGLGSAWRGCAESLMTQSVSRLLGLACDAHTAIQPIAGTLVVHFAWEREGSKILASENTHIS